MEQERLMDYTDSGFKAGFAHGTVDYDDIIDEDEIKTLSYDSADVFDTEDDNDA